MFARWQSCNGTDYAQSRANASSSPPSCDAQDQDTGTTAEAVDAVTEE
jgi:hypothetical protein